MRDYEDLIQWNITHRVFPMVNPAVTRVEYHRLLIERKLWEIFQAGMFQPGLILDVGGEFRHHYMEDRLSILNTKSYTTEYGSCEPDILASITSLPFADNSVPNIVCMETLEHIPNLFRAISELRRVLAPGGVLYATTPFMWPEHGWPPVYTDYWRLTPDAWRFLLNGFSVVEVQPTPLSDPGSRALRYLTSAEGYDVREIDDRFFTGVVVYAVK